MSVYIYKIFNDTHSYIGSTKNIKKRLAVHKTTSRQKYSCSSKIIIESGSYEVEILEECNEINRKEKEQFYIDNIHCVNKTMVNRHERRWDLENGKEYARRKYQYKKSWGGDKRHNNNLLEIDVDLFIN